LGRRRRRQLSARLDGLSCRCNACAPIAITSSSATLSGDSDVSARARRPIGVVWSSEATRLAHTRARDGLVFRMVCRSVRVGGGRTTRRSSPLCTHHVCRPRSSTPAPLLSPSTASRGGAVVTQAQAGDEVSDVHFAASPKTTRGEPAEANTRRFRRPADVETLKMAASAASRSRPSRSPSRPSLHPRPLSSHPRCCDVYRIVGES